MKCDRQAPAGPTGPSDPADPADRAGPSDSRVTADPPAETASLVSNAPPLSSTTFGKTENSVRSASEHTGHPEASEPSETTEATETTGAAGVADSQINNDDEDEDEEDEDKGNSYGTLVMSHGGRSKYLGPTAGSEWLKDVQQLQDAANTPSVTRCPSPEVEAIEQQPPLLPPPINANSGGHQHNFNTSPLAFPINASSAQIRTRDLLARLPPAEEAWALVESYYRYCAWHHDVAPRSRFQETFARVYSFVSPGSAPPSTAINFQEVALVFIVMSKGTMCNIEMPMDDPSAEEWQHLSEMALVKGNFLSNNTIAGVQTLHIMAHKNFNSDKGRRDDKAWLLWGLATRMTQAMGLHRDGARWNLPPDIVEERRKVFWEVNAADIFQAHCFSRPPTINADHCDTEFPSEPRIVPTEKGYFELRFELSQISGEILNMTLKARRPPYSDATILDEKLRKHEQSLPYYIRCRAALLAMVSRYPSPEDAIAASPEPSPRAMPLSFQQSNLALNICETVINLHRPYYAKALYEDTNATHNSMYAVSFYAVIERCAMIIAIVADIHARYPAISTRQWNLWYHVFGSALCLGTLILKHPTHAMANFALLQIDTAIALFMSLVQNGANTPRYQRNLQWLQKLRSRATAKMDEAGSLQQGKTTTADAAMDTAGTNTNNAGQQDERDVELLGWRTRLIRQAGQQAVQHTVINTRAHGGKSKGNRSKNRTNPKNNSSSRSSGGGNDGSNGNNDTYCSNNNDSSSINDGNNYNNHNSHNNHNNSYDDNSSIEAVTANTTPTAVAGHMPAMNGQMALQATEEVLREFWDPIMLQDLLDGTIDPNYPPTQQFTTSLMNSGPSWWEWEYGPAGS
ncbi:hypothetical protein SBRCBS47491_009387 [Sporothrix bragantina]|uniref:Xylanolytic transcriptional activator regulatory domain-containing protein n=1 Tax=Sporothrix bragantina TaxID=671064 RepID=A0ABP0CUD9_9PEZI